MERLFTLFVVEVLMPLTFFACMIGSASIIVRSLMLGPEFGLVGACLGLVAFCLSFALFMLSLRRIDA